MNEHSREKNITFNNHNIDISTVPLGKGQDFITSGSGYYFTGELIHWILVLDGHGSDTCINFLRTYEWDEIILREKEIIKYIYNQFAKFMQIGYNFYDSGSTFSLVKIFPNKREIETINVGDSQIAIFVNNELTYINERHDPSNIYEYNRINHMLERYKPFIRLYDFKVISNDKLEYNLENYYCNFVNGTRISMTQSLGHNNKMSIMPCINKVVYNETDKIKIICGSDGFWDMISLDKNKFNDLNDLIELSCDELLKKIENRWKQKWFYDDIDENKNEVVRETVFTNIDDVSVGTYTNY